jgi:hypothetical protein
MQHSDVNCHFSHFITEITNGINCSFFLFLAHSRTVEKPVRAFWVMCWHTMIQWCSLARLFVYPPKFLCSRSQPPLFELLLPSLF